MDILTMPDIPTQRSCPFDPPDGLRQMREEAPVTRVRTPRGDTAWLITRHGDIRAVLADTRFSSDPTLPGFPTYLTGDIVPPPGFFLLMDFPDHKRLRSLIVEELKGTRLKALHPLMERVVEHNLARIAELKGPFDLITAFALPVGAQIICELLGVPYTDHDFVQTCTDTVLDRSRPPEEQERAVVELMEYFDRVVSGKEAEPSDDLIGRLITEQRRSNKVSHAELVGLAALLLLSAYDTMAQVIGLGTVVLLQNPEQLQCFMQKPDMAERFVDEMVRYLSVNQAGLPRVATADVQVGDQLIRAGEGVILMINAGNRDTAAYDSPDTFDICRRNKNHLGFGHGLHKCIGAHFARTELQIVFRALFSRLPSLVLAVPEEELRYRNEMVLYGLKALPVKHSGAGNTTSKVFLQGNNSMIRILAISGSLRAASLNTAILRVVAQRAQALIEVTLFEGLGDMPLFNPDVEGSLFMPVLNLRAALTEADAVLIASPEYAHGVTGVIKNALDWVVGSAELENKPIAVLCASSRSEYAPAALRKTLSIMGGMVVDGACLTLPFISNSTTAEQAAAMPDVVAVLDRILAELAAAVTTKQ